MVIRESDVAMAEFVHEVDGFAHVTLFDWWRYSIDSGLLRWHYTSILIPLHQGHQLVSWSLPWTPVLLCISHLYAQMSNCLYRRVLSAISTWGLHSVTFRYWSNVRYPEEQWDLGHFHSLWADNANKKKRKSRRSLASFSKGPRIYSCSILMYKDLALRQEKKRRFVTVYWRVQTNNQSEMISTFIQWWHKTFDESFVNILILGVQAIMLMPTTFFFHRQYASSCKTSSAFHSQVDSYDLLLDQRQAANTL